MASYPLIDTEMVDEVVKLGFSRNEVIQSVKSRQQNKVRELVQWYSLSSHTSRMRCEHGCYDTLSQVVQEIIWA